MAISKIKLQQNIHEVIAAVTALKEDDSVPKNIKSKLETILSNLNEDCEPSLKVSKSLHILDEIAEDLNIQSFVRTQIWNISSMLEKFNQ